MGLEEACSARLDRLDVLIVAFLFAGGSPCVHPCEETYLPEPIERATGATCVPLGGFAGLSGRSHFGQMDILACVLT